MQIQTIIPRMMKLVMCGLNSLGFGTEIMILKSAKSIASIR